MIGVSVLSVIALMVGAFSVIFALLDPLVSDFVQSDSGNDPPSTQVAAQLAETPPTTDAGEAPAPTATVPPAAEPTATVPPATPPPADAFAPDYEVTSSARINFRQGPGVRNAVVTTLAPGTPVQSLGGSELTQDPANDRLAATGRWLEFKLEDGQEGWIRDVDVAPLAG
ncbi:MAG: SH3 domain-containing protein [Chloroflexia bacterium]|nr:SH3 domain-containing protein [Chloroflexia bacterium]